MSKVREEIKEIMENLSNVPVHLGYINRMEAEHAELKALVETVVDLEKAAEECNIDKFFAGIVEVEWHRSTLTHILNRLHVQGEITDAQRGIIETAAHAIRNKAFKAAENALINNCSCRF